MHWDGPRSFFLSIVSFFNKLFGIDGARQIADCTEHFEGKKTPTTYAICMHHFWHSLAIMCIVRVVFIFCFSVGLQMTGIRINAKSFDIWPTRLSDEISFTQTVCRVCSFLYFRRIGKTSQSGEQHQNRIIISC